LTSTICGRLQDLENLFSIANIPAHTIPTQKNAAAFDQNQSLSKHGQSHVAIRTDLSKTPYQNECAA
jgi:hypothetical protein